MRANRVGRLYTVAEAARELGVCYKTVLRRVQAGQLDTLTVGRSHLVSLDAARAACRRTYRRRA